MRLEGSLPRQRDDEAGVAILRVDRGQEVERVRPQERAIAVARFLQRRRKQQGRVAAASPQLVIEHRSNELMERVVVGVPIELGDGR